MNNYSIYLPSYSIGPDVYKDIYRICSPYGKRIIAVGGKRAIKSVRDELINAVKDSDLAVSGFLWHGGESSYENVEKLMENNLVKEADMIFAIGGGKATDTAKALAEKLEKPVFTFPTIASNCSACTSVSIMYNEDGSFKEPFFLKKPPIHAFIQTGVIVNTPYKYMWAGIGDTYAKYFESEVSSRGEDLPHYEALGVTTAIQCYEPLIKYGEKALSDQKNGTLSYEFEQVVLAIIVTTAIASILLTSERKIDYNTGFGHAIYYALTSFPHIEEGHLHGELVAYGILLLLLIDGNKEEFEKLYAFNKSIGLPLRMSDVEIGENDLDDVINTAISMKDIEHNPYEITYDMVRDAFRALESLNMSFYVSQSGIN